MVNLLPKRHGLGIVDSTKLAHALCAFAIQVATPARWYEPETAFGECADAADEFCKFACYDYDLRFKKHQYYFKAHCYPPESDRARNWGTWSADQARADRERYPFYRRGGYSDHWVAQLGHLMVDWTARQFLRRAPWPALWIDDPNENEDY